MPPDEHESYHQSDEAGQTWLRSAIRGDRGAFDRFVDRYKRRLMGYLLQRIGDAHRAEDLLQEVFLKAFASGGPAGKGEAVMTAWLFTIARRTVLDYLRTCRRKPLKLADELDDRATPPEHEPLAVLLHRESLLRAASVLNDLPAEQQEVIALRFQGGLTYAQIASVLGEPEGTIKSRLWHGLRRLKKTLTEGDRECGS